MLRKVVIGSGLLALVPAVRAATPIEDKPKAVDDGAPAKPSPMRSSDLPIYDAPHADYGEYVDSKSNERKESYVRSLLHEPISTARHQVQTIWEGTSSAKQALQDNLHDIQDRTEWVVTFLREEENKEVRYGAVAMGGLTGFIFGLRGGIIRRLFYASVGSTLMGAVCFPEETSELAHTNAALAKQYINIAYNFFYGVKPGDPQLEVKFPELSFPKDFSEFVDLSVSVASSIKQAVMPPPAKETKPETPPDKKE